MYPTPDLARAVQAERARAIAGAPLRRLAACARDCCATPTNLLSRLIRAVRPSASVAC